MPEAAETADVVIVGGGSAGADSRQRPLDPGDAVTDDDALAQAERIYQRVYAG